MKEKEPSEWVGKKRAYKWRYKEFISQTCKQSMELNLLKKKKKKEKWAKDRNGCFSIEGIQVDIKYAKNAQRP